MSITRAATAPMRVGDVEIGSPATCFVIAEAGVNHNGDLARAHRLVDVAADGGADAVKFQTFDPDAVVSTGAEAAPYQRRQGQDRQDEMLSRLVLAPGAWVELAAHAADRGLRFLSTAFDPASLEIVVGLGVSALKVPSGELDNPAFVRRVASQGLPVILSTGMGSMSEVHAAVDAASSAPSLCLLHCVTAYPTPLEACNLRAIPTMAAAFGVPVGWSDHTVGSISAVAAVALGATILEKHVTVDRGLPGPDHAASEDPASFEAYVSDARAAASVLGDGVKRAQVVEQGNRVHARRSYHARRDLQPGDVVGDEDVVLLRPATGLPPSSAVVGRTIVRAVDAGAPLMAGDLV